MGASPAPTGPLRACPCCGLVQHLPALAAGERAACVRCETRLAAGGSPRSRARTAAAAWAALFLYPLAISLPIMRIERFGHRSDASIWTGSVGLLGEGEWLVGGVVLACSLVLPLFKLAGLLLITSRLSGVSRRRRARTYRWIEWTGRFGMLDVLLIAVVVAWVKVGDLVEVRAGPAALAFTACVLLSLIASACFDPHALWEDPALEPETP